MGRFWGLVRCFVTPGGALWLSSAAFANDVQPQLYSNVPTGVSFYSFGYSNSSGEVSFDSSVPVVGAEGDIDSWLFSYSRGIALGERSGLLSIAIPHANVHFEGLYLGRPASANRTGMGDPRIRLAVNLSGAPAMGMNEFRTYRQDTIVGVSVEVSAPLGRYLEDKLINIGSNRWSVVGQFGASHRAGNWAIEGAVGASFYTANDDVLGNGRLEQDPIGMARGVLRYYFRPAIWLGTGFIYSYGGATTLNGFERDDRQSNWRTGVALSVPIAPRHQLQLLATEGVSARIGSDFRTYSITYTYTRF